jgi:RNA 3'-terminal phosphate cyclase (ATP)
VAREALCQTKDYLVAGGPVGRYLADQLMLPLGIVACLGSRGGIFRTMGLSFPGTTRIEIPRRFLEIGIQADREDCGNCLVRLGYGPQ